MSLNRGWKKIVRHAWSIRLLLLAGALSGGEAALPFVQGFLNVPAGVFAGLSALVIGAAFIARLLAQKQFGGND